MRKKSYKKILLFILIAPFALCGFFCPDSINIKDVVTDKEKIDTTTNPAHKYLLKQELSEKEINMSNILVKDVTASTNIDYDYCVIADVDTQKGKVECYIFTKNIHTISKLKNGKTRINVKGQFGRFFTMLDEYYTKIEIITASIEIIEEGSAPAEKTAEEAAKPEESKEE
ncbi:MAG: hypothetical protein GY754_19350 [bacterium]|nr:hypothetical protein [bacterium]